MQLEELLHPLTVDRFREHYFGKRSFAIVRPTNPIEGIVTLDEIEARLNDGCGSMSALAVIGQDGRKLPSPSIYAARDGRRWSPFSVHKAKVKALLEGGHSFVLHNGSEMNPRLDALIASIEAAFPGFHADVHLYVSPRAAATSYDVHRDDPQHKIYVQLVGTTHWTVYEGETEAVSMPVSVADETLAVDFRETLTPGSVLYMPPRVYHRVTNPDGPRISLSIPFYEDPTKAPIDRTHIPLRALFESGGER